MSETIYCSCKHLQDYALSPCVHRCYPSLASIEGRLQNNQLPHEENMKLCQPTWDWLAPFLYEKLPNLFHTCNPATSAYYP